MGFWTRTETSCPGQLWRCFSPATMIWSDFFSMVKTADVLTGTISNTTKKKKIEKE